MKWILPTVLSNVWSERRASTRVYDRRPRLAAEGRFETGSLVRHSGIRGISARSSASTPWKGVGKGGENGSIPGDIPAGWQRHGGAIAWHRQDLAWLHSYCRDQATCRQPFSILYQCSSGGGSS